MVTFNVAKNTLHISLKQTIDDSYDILFGEDLFKAVSQDLKQNPLGSCYAVIADSNVSPLYAKKLQDSLNKASLQSEIFTFQAGEKNKTIETCLRIIEQMFQKKLGRDSAIIALGGGVTGDMAGLIAALYNRGIPYIQVPTTIVSQADSSIGGKTAVDTTYGKNLIGSFKQPKKVYVDIKTLETLPSREYIAGLAETIKHAIIQDQNFFSYIENHIEDSNKRAHSFSLEIAKKNCEIKGTIVELDTHESDLRMILNYGHTIGHAIELLSNFEILHGEAIAIGMNVSGTISNILGHFSKEDLKRQNALFQAVGLPINFPKDINEKEILDLICLDKKAKAGRARFVLPQKIGKMLDFNGSYATFVDDEILLKAIELCK